jgi:hypothetical protein
MSILLTIVVIIGVFYAALFLVTGGIYGLAIFRAKRKDKNNFEQAPTTKVDSKQILVSNIDESEVKNSLEIQPKNIVSTTAKIGEISHILNDNKGNNIALLVFGSMIGLDADHIISENANIISKFEEYCTSVLNKDNFIQITKARIELGEYGNSIPEGVEVYYEIFVEEFFERFKYIFINFNAYVELIKTKGGVIAAKKRSLVSEDEFGDLDGSLWVDYLQRFAAKMNLVNPHASITAEFEAANEIFKILNLDNFQGKVLGYIFALNEHLEKNNDPLANVITGIDFELHLKSLLEAALPNVYVETTPASGDHGADLIARYKGITVAIQAKYYTGSVGNGAVQEIHSGMGFYDADFGMVVTQSTYTDHAISLANKLGIYLESVDSFVDKIKMLAK